MTQVIDRAALDVLLKTVGGDVEFLGELIGDFFDDSPQQLATARQALEANDAEALRRAAHSLKSTSNNLGARPLAALCRDLEALGREGQMDRAPEILAAIDAEYARAHAALLAESA